MARDGLQYDPDRPGFPIYGPAQLPKVNAMRAADSQPDFRGVPILHAADVMFTRASEMGNKPASCYTCHMQNARKGQVPTCMLLGKEVAISKLNFEGIEYWPCCGMHDYGAPNTDEPMYVEHLSSPDTVGLIWINAPEVGQKYGGANCGGGNGGDDCDHYMIESGEKWSSETGMCRVLQRSVDNGDVCTAWRDDDILDWKDAQNIIQGKAGGEEDKKRLVKSIMERED